MNNQMKIEETRHTLNKACVGMLDHGNRVFVCGYGKGTVKKVYEPEWIDHKTKCFRKELQSAVVQLDSGECFDFPCNRIIKLEEEDGHK